MSIDALWLRCNSFPLPFAEVHNREKLNQFRSDAKPLLRDLIKLANHPDRETVRLSIELISKMGVDGQSAANALSQIANDVRKTGMTRWAAVNALLFVTPETKSVVRLLMPSVDSLNDLVPMDENIGANGISLSSTVIAMYADVASRLLIDTGHTKHEIASLLEITSSDNEANIRTLAIATLGAVGSEAKAAVKWTPCAGRKMRLYSE